MDAPALARLEHDLVHAEGTDPEPSPQREEALADLRVDPRAGRAVLHGAIFACRARQRASDWVLPDGARRHSTRAIMRQGVQRAAARASRRGGAPTRTRSAVSAPLVAESAARALACRMTRVPTQNASTAPRTRPAESPTVEHRNVAIAIAGPAPARGQKQSCRAHAA